MRKIENFVNHEFTLSGVQKVTSNGKIIGIILRLDNKNWMFKVKYDKNNPNGFCNIADITVTTPSKIINPIKVKCLFAEKDHDIIIGFYDNGKPIVKIGTKNANPYIKLKGEPRFFFECSI